MGAEQIQQSRGGAGFLLAAAIAGLCWAALLAMLLFGGASPHDPPLALQRVLYYSLAGGALLFTFAPIERHLGLFGLTTEGVLGGGLLLYCLAFIPPPHGWLLALPDLPIYGLLMAALFLSGAALSRPLLHVIGQRLFHQRVLARDARRVRRQSYEVGLLLAACAALAGLRVLTWVSLLLLTTAIVIAELLLLSMLPAPPNTSQS